MAAYPGRQARRGGAWGIMLIGVALCGATLAYGVRIAQSNTQSLLFKSFEILVLIMLAATVAYAGHWLSRSELGNTQLWHIASWVGIGVIFTLALSVWQVLMQLRNGVVLEEPLIAFVVTQAVGATAGLLVGVYHVHQVTQVREMRAQTREARNAHDQLAFLNTVLRHHLFNGMQVIQSYTNHLSDHVDESGRTYLETIQHRSERLVTLVENMQVLVRSLSKEQDLESIDVVGTIEREATHLTKTYESTAISITGPETLSVRVDSLFPAVIENLLRSAIERSRDPSPSVSITITEQGDHAQIDITTTRPTIDHGIAKTIRDGWRTDSMTESDDPDLYIARELIDRYGGEFESVADESGRSFRIWLPIES